MGGGGGTLCTHSVEIGSMGRADVTRDSCLGLCSLRLAAWLVPVLQLIYNLASLLSLVLDTSASSGQEIVLDTGGGLATATAAHTAQLLQLSQEIFVFTLGTAAAGLLLLANIV